MAVSSFIRDNSIVGEDEVKAFLAITKDDDNQSVRLGFILRAAKRAADEYTDGYFDLTDTEVPEPIELWILRQCARIYYNPIHGQTRQTVDGQGDDYYQWNWDEQMDELKPYRGFPYIWGPR